MLQKDFKENLVKSLAELGVSLNSDINFFITPIVEPGKKLNTIDDCMRLGLLTKENLDNRLFDLIGAIKILSAPDSRFPLWITVELIEKKDDKYIVELKTSLRFRAPSVLQNQETGHPPFKVIKNEHNK